MRDDEIRARLVEINPWWRATAAGTDPQGWALDDRMLRDGSRYDLGYRSTVLDDIKTDPVDDRLVLLRGPRRVGKSVVLKDTALALCGRADVDPRQIIYLPADGMSTRPHAWNRDWPRPDQVGGFRSPGPTDLATR